MKKIIVSNLVSADGFYEGTDKDLSAFKFDPRLYGVMIPAFDRSDTILMGRGTYEFFASYWPTKTKLDDPAADFMNHYTKIVISKTLEKAPWGKWEEPILIKSNVEESVAKLKQQPGKDIIIFGSGELLSTLSRADLIDEYRFIVNPVILGDGRRMFEQIELKHSLKLNSATVLNHGLVVLDYERDK